MSHPAADALEEIAPEILKRFLAVADKLIEPVVFLDSVDGVISIVEHVSLIATMTGVEAEPLPPEDDSIIVAVVYDDDTISRRRVPDPRVHPELWPWTPSEE